MAREKEAERHAARSGPEIEKSGRGGPLDRGHSSGGALTGETGNLSSESEAVGTAPFVPGETREMSDPLRQGAITELSRHASDDHVRRLEDRAAEPGGREAADASIVGAGPLAIERASGLTGMQGQATAMGGTTSPEVGTEQGGGATELASREGGYGRSRGLDPHDPAYRFDEDAREASNAELQPAAGDEIEGGREAPQTPTPPSRHAPAEPPRRSEPEHL